MVRDRLDLEWCFSFLDEVFDPLLANYFRPRLIGARRIPGRGPAILAANHSGNAFPFDAMVLDAVLWHRVGGNPKHKVRTTFEPELALRWWMRPYGIPDFWRRAGGVDAAFDNVDRLLSRKERVVVFPEGVPGIGKGFHRRYRLQPFHTGSFILAARHGCPFVPIHVVNGEWIVPFQYTIPAIDRLMKRHFRVPFLPLPGGLLAITWPWIWWMSLPARLVYVVGEPIDVAGMAREMGIRDPASAPREAFLPVAERVRGMMQADLDRHVRKYGAAPFHGRSLKRTLLKDLRRAVGLIPTGWPVLWIRHERDRQRAPARNLAHAILRDLDIAAYYIPLGWPLLALLREMRRPPYGWRGVPSDTRRLEEGEYVWKI
jgi:1-acyl-sn-glycerol-3-phosphate acyltransferase